jgi:protein-serine/threonine kinase
MNNQPPHQQQQQQQGQQGQQGQQQQGQAPNRLQLNFGFAANDRNPATNDPRQYPTTPSTFPQPVYPNQNGQQEVWGTGQQNFTGNNYFMSPYQATYGQQQQQQQQQNQNVAPQQQSNPYRSPPPPTGQVAAPAPAYQNDPANGLAQQFAHQNLGGNSPRAASPYGRQPSPANAQQRPRTAGAPGQSNLQYGNFLSPQATPTLPLQPSLTDDEPPARAPEKYGDNVMKKAKVSCGLVGTFFKDNVQRARDRNQRYD